MPDAMKKLLESVYSKSILKIAAVDQALANYPDCSIADDIFAA
jgi:hypothetical protein